MRAGLLVLALACAPQGAPLTAAAPYEKNGKKFERGLYAGGNDMPVEHRLAGERLAKIISPLDPQGKLDYRNGRIVTVALGHSNPLAYFREFSEQVRKRPDVNPRLVFRNFCRSGLLTHEIVEMCRKNAVEFAGPEVQIVYLMTTYHPARKASVPQRLPPEVASLPFPRKMERMRDDLKFIVQSLFRACPNLKMIFLSSDVWRGRSGLEPEVFEEGFAVKWLIAEQARGGADLAFAGGARRAPWLAWGPYLWEPDAPADRYQGDGVHPSEKGASLVVERWLDFLAKDAVARPWFLKP